MSENTRGGEERVLRFPPVVYLSALLDRMKMNRPKHTIACAIFHLFFFVQTFPAFSQVQGCKDPAANNYNSSATVSDGSCTYNPTFYTPPVKVDPISNVL